MAVLAEVARGSNNDVESIDTGLNSNLGIVEMASYVGENLGLELEWESETDKKQMDQRKNIHRAYRWPRSPFSTAQKQRGWSIRCLGND